MSATGVYSILCTQTSQLSLDPCTYACGSEKDDFGPYVARFGQQQY